MYLDSEKTVSANLLADFLLLAGCTVVATIFLLPLRDPLSAAGQPLQYVRAGLWTAALLMQALFLQRLPAHAIFRNSYSSLKSSSALLAGATLGAQLIFTGTALFAAGELWMQLFPVWYFIVFIPFLLGLFGWVLYQIWQVRPVQTSAENFQGFINPNYHPLGEFVSETVRIGVGRKVRPPSTISLFFPVMLVAIGLYFAAFFFDSYLRTPVLEPGWYVAGFLSVRWILVSVSDFRPWFKFFLAGFTGLFTAIMFLGL